MTRRTSTALAGYLFLAPYLVLFLTFLLGPLLFGLVLSFMKYEMVSPEPPRFSGVENYREALLKPNPNPVKGPSWKFWLRHGDPYFWKALGATSLFVVFSVPIVVSTALLFAAGIEAIPGRRQEVYRLAIFLPTMITISVGGILWRWFYNSEFGLFNALLAPFGIKVPWLTESSWAMASIILMTLWWTVGGPTVILLAGLKQIPDAYYEAAALDGATGVKRFFLITLPLLKPVLLFVTVINVIGAFQIFGQTFMITRGGPELKTRVLVQYIYEVGFNHYRLGYAAAMSWLLFVVIAIFSAIQFRVLREK